MGHSLPKDPSSTPLNSLATRMAKASIPINREETSRDFDPASVAVSLVFETIADMGMSEKEAAYTMAIDPAQLSRVKSGQARLPFDALWRMSDEFWQRFGERIGAERGLTAVHQRKVKAARIAELVRLLVEAEAAS